MKKFFSCVITFCLGLCAFAFDATAFLAPASGVKSYIKTDYTIASKFGEYFRTPNAKYQHIFNNFGQEVENSELSVDGKIVDKVVYSYDSKGRIVEQTGYDDSENVIWKVVNTYDSNGLKIEESEYDGKNNLCSKSIFKYQGTNCVDETFYNGNGALIWKNIFVYDEKNLNTESYSYYANGSNE